MQTFSRLAIEAGYAINKSYVAQNLCENKDKPSMRCCGKCFLKKQLKKQDRQEQSTNNKKESQEVQLFFAVSDYFVRTWQPIEKNEYFIVDNNHLPFFPRSVFHPPATPAFDIS